MTNKLNILAATAVVALLIGAASAKAGEDPSRGYWGGWHYDDSAAYVDGEGWSNGGVVTKPHADHHKGYKKSSGSDGPDTITGASDGYFSGSAAAATNSATASVGTSGSMGVIAATTDGYADGGFSGGGYGEAGASNYNGTGWGWNGKSSSASVGAENSSTGGVTSRGNASAGTAAQSAAGGTASASPNSTSASVGASGGSATGASSSNGGSASGGSSGGGSAAAGASSSKSGGGAS